MTSALEDLDFPTPAWDMRFDGARLPVGDAGETLWQALACSALDTAGAGTPSADPSRVEVFAVLEPAATMLLAASTVPAEPAEPAEPACLSTPATVTYGLQHLASAPGAPVDVLAGVQVPAAASALLVVGQHQLAVPDALGGAIEQVRVWVAHAVTRSGQVVRRARLQGTGPQGLTDRGLVLAPDEQVTHALRQRLGLPAVPLRPVSELLAAIVIDRAGGIMHRIRSRAEVPGTREALLAQAGQVPAQEETLAAMVGAMVKTVVAWEASGCGTHTVGVDGRQVLGAVVEDGAGLAGLSVPERARVDEACAAIGAMSWEEFLSSVHGVGLLPEGVREHVVSALEAGVPPGSHALADVVLEATPAPQALLGTAEEVFGAPAAAALARLVQDWWTPPEVSVRSA